MRKDSEFEPEKKSSPTNITPVERMKSIPRYSPTEDLTTYAPVPKGKIMFPNFTGWSYIKAALFTLVTFDGVLMTAGAFSPAINHDAMIASLLLGAAGTVVSTLSGTAAGTPAVDKLMMKRTAAAVSTTPVKP